MTPDARLGILVGLIPVALLGWLACVAGGAGDCPAGAETVASLRHERVTGSLATAETRARRLLGCPDLDPSTRRGVQIELARILDRVGLHQNTRPVVEALEILRKADSAVPADDDRGRALIELALAEYYYRAEMGEREFPVSAAHAGRARDLYQELEDSVGQTDAVHRLGLIALQKRNLQEARELFDRSLELSRSGSHRPIFLSDYHRHVGFVDRLQDDGPAAIAHFEKSLAYRDEAGSRDYGLFARTMLATALVDGGRAAEARPHLDEALEIARDLPSPIGELRATYARGKMHEALGDEAAARRAYRRALDLATALGVTGLQGAARERLQGLGEPTGEDPSRGEEER